MKKRNITYSVLLILSLSQNLSSFDIGDVGKLLQDEVGNLDLGSFLSTINIECDWNFNLPEIYDFDLCNQDVDWNWKFKKYEDIFNVIHCKVDGDKIGISGKVKDIAPEFCENVDDNTRYFTQTSNEAINYTDTMDLRFGSETEEVEVSSAYTQETSKVKIVDPTLPNGKKESSIYSPDGTLGFDAIYGNSEKIPQRLRDAYFNDDYFRFATYDRYAKVVKSDDIDFRNVEPNIPLTYMQYKQEVQLSTYSHLKDLVTPYSLEKKIELELEEIKEDYTTEGETSEELKKSYLENNQKMLKELITLDDQYDGDRTYARELAKGVKSLENYELVKFSEEEDNYKLKNGYIINPSRLKVMSKNENIRLDYSEKIFRQQTNEIRRRTEAYGDIQRKKELLEIVAKKVFYANLKYEPKIAEKEIEEIIEESGSEDSDSGGGSSGGGSGIPSGI